MEFPRQDPRIQPASPALAGRFFTPEPPANPREPQFPLLCDGTTIALAFQVAQGATELRRDSGGERGGSAVKRSAGLIVSIKLCPRRPLSGLISSALLLFYSPALLESYDARINKQQDQVHWKKRKGYK